MKIRKMLMIALLFFLLLLFWTGEETYPHGNAK